MAKMPENDNLVMESIEDLFNQADSVSIKKGNGTLNLEREQVKNIPIIGARPLRLEKDAPATEDILVLAGQKRPLSDQAEPLFAVESQIEAPSPPTAEAPAENPESENPFLAIRQAVISAGDADSTAGTDSDDNIGPSRADKKTPDAASQQQANPSLGPYRKTSDQNISAQKTSIRSFSDRNFTDQIAQLIDNEIEVRLKAQLSIIALADHPAKAATRGEETSTKTPPAKKTGAKRAAAVKKVRETKKQATKTQKKSPKRAATPTAKGTKKAPSKKPATGKSLASKKTRASKKIAPAKKIAAAKKKS